MLKKWKNLSSLLFINSHFLKFFIGENNVDKRCGQFDSYLYLCHSCIDFTQVFRCACNATHL